MKDQEEVRNSEHKIVVERKSANAGRDAMSTKLIETEMQNPAADDSTIGALMGLEGIGIDSRVKALRESSEYTRKKEEMQRSALDILKEALPTLRDIVNDPEHPKAVAGFVALSKLVTEQQNNTINIVVNQQKYSIGIIPRDWTIGDDQKPLHLPSFEKGQAGSNMAASCRDNGCQFSQISDGIGESLFNARVDDDED